MRVIWMAVAALGMATGMAHAQLAPPQRAVDSSSPRSSELSSQAAEALVRGKPADAVRLSDEAIADDARNPWAHYNRGAALTDLGRTNEAVAAFRVAQRSFSREDAWGKSIAMYGQANALAQAGRCAEARPFFEAYAAYVERVDGPAAGMARRYARECEPRR
jgi:tetratricopeptide (TPR) repeat protein